MDIKQAVILAGGRGERLRPLTNRVPKPMIPINGKPFLEYLIELLKENGIEEIVLLLGYLSNKIKDYFGDGSKFGVRIKYSISEVSDETGTRIKKARHLLDDYFLILYGDTYWPLNLQKMTENYRKLNVLATVTVYNNKDGYAEYGSKSNISVSKQGIILDYDKTCKNPLADCIDIGYFILNKSVLDLMPENNFSFEKEILPKLIEKKQLGAYITKHAYYYLTSMETLKHAESFLNPKKIILLDRDGVINKRAKEHDYVKNWNEFEFIPGSIEAMKLLSQNNYKIIIISNQAGILRGIFTKEDLNNIHENMKKELEKYNIKISDIYYCPHRQNQNCECRKPNPGMFFQAAKEHHFDLTKTVFIGDTIEDVQAGEAAGVKTILVEENNNLLNIVKNLII